MARFTILIPVVSSALAPSKPSKALMARMYATPPPGMIPSSIAARVAHKASSTRSFLLFHFHLTRRTDIEHSHTTAQLSQTLLQLLFVVVAGRVGNLILNLIDTILDEFALPVTVDDGRVILRDSHLVAST